MENFNAVSKKNKESQAVFTLVEIVIVLVTIGLLIGSVLKDQAMVQNAKVTVLRRKQVNNHQR